jgi:pimeloyl-ACP methyl ester carboxylesterase
MIPRASGAMIPPASGAIIPSASGAISPPADGAMIPHADGAMIPHADGAIIPLAGGGIIHRISAWDGLKLHVREWSSGAGEGSRLPPILCLPGLVRTGADFEALVPAIVRGRRVITLDYPGRGASGRCRDVSRYAPEPCVRDVLDVCAALHIHHTVVIGTSFGGLLAMGLAAARSGLIQAVVLNDIGPDIGTEGADYVRDFAGRDPALDSLEACVALLRTILPPMSLDGDAAWRRMAELTYQAGPDGRFHPVWDTAIARLLNRPPPDLWPLFDALTHLPVLLVRGAVSNILLVETVTRMQAVHPDLTVVTLPGIGHAPILTEPPALAAIETFLSRNVRRTGA